MPWCAVKGTFFLAYGDKETLEEGRNPLNELGMSGDGNGVILVLSIRDGKLGKAGDFDQHVHIPSSGVNMAIFGDMSNTSRAKLYAPNTDAGVRDALDALFDDGWVGLKDVFNSLQDVTLTPDTSTTVSLNPTPTLDSSITVTIGGHSTSWGSFNPQPLVGEVITTPPIV